MQVKKETDQLVPCRCGFQPTYYSIGYGSTPYSVFCPVCKKQTDMTKYAITGWVGNLIHYWNNHVAGMTVEELNAEKKEVELRDKVDRLGRKTWGVEPAGQWYWYADKKPYFSTR